MNEAGSLESSWIYPVLIVTEIRGLSLGADMLNQRFNRIEKKDIARDAPKGLR